MKTSALLLIHWSHSLVETMHFSARLSVSKNIFSVIITFLFCALLTLDCFLLERIPFFLYQTYALSVHSDLVRHNALILLLIFTAFKKSPYLFHKMRNVNINTIWWWHYENS